MSDYTASITYPFETYAQFLDFIAYQVYGYEFIAEINDADTYYIGNLRISSIITSVQKGKTVEATVLAGSSAVHDANLDLWKLTLKCLITRVESAPPYLRLV